MERNQDDANLLDSHHRLISAVVSHFRTLTLLATIQARGEAEGVDPQTIAVTGMSMQVEFERLSTTVKDFLALSRRLKELWLFGRLGGEDEQAKAQAEQLDRDVIRVSELVNSIQGGRYAQLAEENGGTWEALVEKTEPEGTATQPAPTPAP